MTDHFTTMFRLTDQLRDLDMVQTWIDDARISAQTNQRVQLELDRRQTELNRKRAMIRHIMADIARRN